MSPAWRLFLYGVTLAGFAAIGLSIYQLWSPGANAQWLILALLTLITAWCGVRIPVLNSKIFIGDSLFFANILLFGTPAGVVTAALNGVAGSLRSRSQGRGLQHAVFNVAALACSAQAAGMLYSRLNPARSLSHGFDARLADMLLPLGALVIAYHLISSGSHAVLVAMQKHRSPWAVWKDGALENSVANFAGITAAALISIYAGAAAPKVLGIIVPVSLAVYFACRMFLKRFRETHSLAYYDSLTGLPNRVLFKNKLEEALAWSEQQKRMLAVMFLDLDHFKEINDTFGHNTGDLLLKSVASRLAGNVRSSDSERYLVRDDQDIIIGRFGGDEFTVLMKGTLRPEDAVRIAQRFLNLLSDPYSLNGREIEATATIGISMYPFDGTSAETLLKKADVALYHAKESGRGGHQLYSQSMNERSSEKAVREKQLREALEKKEFELLYQPRIDVLSGEISGAEAFLRWRHPNRGLIRAADFIALAEETGLIKPIGEWVLQTVCAQILAWRRDGVKVVPVSINLSPLQFRQPNLPESIAKVLKNNVLEPAWLQVELTESALVENEQEADGVLEKFRKLGIKVSVDDFGTGHFSLSRLRGFQVDALKIDISFVNDCHRDPDSQSIIAAIVALGRIMGFTVEAEGIETEQQLEFLIGQGVVEFQGCFFSKPLSAIELAELLRSRKRFLPPKKREMIEARLPAQETAPHAAFRPVSM